MESLYIWLFIFAGATIALLGMFLLASERELKRQRRESAELRRRQTDNPPSPAESMIINQELIEKISSLSSRLEESQRTIDELQAQQRRLVSAQSENQQLNENIVNLRNQLQTSETQLGESVGQVREISERNSLLQTEAVELKRELQANRKTLEELQSEQPRWRATQCENQQLRIDNQQLQQETAELRHELQTSQALLSTTAGQYKEAAERDSQLESELAELNQQKDKLTTRNNQLLEEINSLSKQLAESQTSAAELQTLQGQLSLAQSENRQLHAAIQELEQEIAKIKNQLEASESRLSESGSENRQIAASNAKLQTTVVEMKQQFQASQATIEELQAAQQQLGGVRFENQQLQQEIANLGSRLEWGETRLSESASQTQEAADRYARLQKELADLTQKAEEGRVKARELEAVRQRLANFEAREMIFKDQQHKLEGQVADLQRELSTRTEKLEELEATHNRLAEMEHLCRDLDEKNRRLEEEVSQWQQRISVGKESERQVSTLPQQLEELPTKGTALHSTTAPGIELTPESTEFTIAHQADRSPAETLAANGPMNGVVANGGDDPAHVGSDEPGNGIQVITGAQIRQVARSSRNRKWRLALLPANIAILAIIVLMDFRGTDSDRLSGSKQPAVVAQTESYEQWIASEPDSNTQQRSAPLSVSASGETEFSRQTSASKPARLQGTFKVTRPTRVYSRPSEASSLIASVGPGMTINVVDSGDGWLEIRSKHGRPPGFIRQDAAVRVGQN